MKKRILYTLLGLFIFPIMVFSQTIIKGKVATAKGEGIIAASIKQKGSNKGAVSDQNGEFQISVPDNSILVFSAIGYVTREVEAKSPLTVILSEDAQNLGDFVVVGTRGKARSSILTPVPVDVIKINSVNMPTAKMDLTSILNSASPSFNFNKQSGSDGADQIDLATLRGLGPDQTLVLVNGKRRHQTAFVAVFGTRGRGNSGTDLNAIPESSIDRVEILRDGASAQYGSDAIAGVINLILKKDVGVLSINTGYSGYYDPKFNTHYGKELGQYRTNGAIDGNAFSLGANYGVALGKNNGFINFSGNFFANGKTFRQNLNTDLSTKDGLPINTVRRSTGDGSVTSGGLMYNMELPIANTKTIIYSFGGGNAKASSAYAYTRNLSERPERFPDGVAGNPILQTTIDGETYFDPIIETKIQDLSFAGGVRGVWGSDWNWDLSNTLGRNNFHFYGDQTFNASLGAGKTHFDDGGFSFLQNTVNFNLSKLVDVASGLNLAFGLEQRYENYKIYAGEKDSYANYNANKATGAQGFPGYQPGDEVDASRSNVAAYVDAELDATDKWLIGVAVRAENYNDFGFTSNYKLATRYKLTSNFNLRGSLSTGFRAPSLQQINFSNTFTNVQGGNVFEVKIAPNYSPITKAAGIPDLKQEKSINASLGFSWKPFSNVTVTLDGYRINIKDRVVLSGQFDESIPALKPILNQLNVAQAQFFANAVNTTNYGLDLVVDYTKRFDNNTSIKVLFTGNLNHLNIDKINIPAALNGSYDTQQAFFSDREQAYIKASAPPVKLGLNLDYGFGNWMVGTHFLYYGKISILGYGYENTYPPLVNLDNTNTSVLEQFNYSGKMVSDVYASYKISKRVTIFFGADNVFNVHPDLGYVQGAKLSAYDGETGGAWDAVQMGFNGLKLFTKLAFNF
ncbi:TonB-dependent receptor [Pedobacter mucosus]|uniref:TonB-dependent receptor n=1 Tax=Pedobacter mucosus TaxID=2895286 RepID=UPI001EE3CB8D|nr:TonB-dependent receptor [Pedobacter mucosus]UKT64615.1 TonB-dependent receptor [Pedobacter mucosus]